MRHNRYVTSKPAIRLDPAAARRRGVEVIATALMLAALALPAGAQSWAPPPPNAKFDYQIGGDYPLPSGVEVVTRDWFAGSADAAAYSICYVNAFQTQDDEDGVDRPDERSAWPAGLVLRSLGDDPNWGGEYLIDISSSAMRAQAADWVQQMIQTCADKGFDAVEYDNLDSWRRFDRKPLEDEVPFGKAQAIRYAELLTDRAHALGLAVAQKNTPELSRRVSRRVIGFDFAVAESCGRYAECHDYRALFGNRVIAIEYRRKDFRRACRAVGSRVSVVLRDRNVTLPGSGTHRYAAC
jgi:Glycoside-hydrolase family GH114